MSNDPQFVAGFEAARKLAIYVVQLAREGRLDTDFRSIKSVLGGLKPGDTVESFLAYMDKEWES